MGFPLDLFSFSPPIAHSIRSKSTWFHWQAVCLGETLKGTPVFYTKVGCGTETRRSKSNETLVLERNASNLFHYGIDFDHVCSFSTKSAHGLSREPFDLIHRILHGRPHRHCLQPDRIWPHYLLPVGNYGEKVSKILPPTVSGGISRERLKHGSRPKWLH